MLLGGLLCVGGRYTVAAPTKEPGAEFMGGRLSAKVAVVTGGSRGIGLAIATAMASEGAKVVVASRKPDGVAAAVDAINAQYPGQAQGHPCHVGRAEDIDALLAWTAENVGLVDVLVNNAGTNPFFGPLMQISEEAFEKTFEVNLKSVWRLSQRVAKGLIDAKRPGSIINISSVLGLRGAPLQGAYGMTKAAIVAFTQTLALELGQSGIRVNAIAPGLIDTKLAAAIVRNQALTQAFTDRTAARRVGRPDEIGGAAVFLASDESSYITGQTLAIDGGYTAS
ncbi:MAG: NAD(P)-dependent dehydrogenase (short-subunit alcohol dehydrogenase family) [Myxococcota bacterium]|jgi:NAD(P)-dependent dehydrogenase (short-subunit alcohol dehydrogenase family)